MKMIILFVDSENLLNFNENHGRIEFKISTNTLNCAPNGLQIITMKIVLWNNKQFNFSHVDFVAVSLSGHFLEGFPLHWAYLLNLIVFQ